MYDNKLTTKQGRKYNKDIGTHQYLGTVCTNWDRILSTSSVLIFSNMLSFYLDNWSILCPILFLILHSFPPGLDNSCAHKVKLYICTTISCPSRRGFFLFSSFIFRHFNIIVDSFFFKLLISYYLYKITFK